jgi:hypothetical protein
MARQENPSFDEAIQAIDDDELRTGLVELRRLLQQSLGNKDESLLDDLTSLIFCKVSFDFMAVVYNNTRRTNRAFAEITDAVKALKRGSTELAQLTPEWLEFDGISQIVLDLDSAIEGAERALDRFRDYTLHASPEQLAWFRKNGAGRPADTTFRFWVLVYYRIWSSANEGVEATAYYDDVEGRYCGDFLEYALPHVMRQTGMENEFACGRKIERTLKLIKDLGPLGANVLELLKP